MPPLLTPPGMATPPARLPGEGVKAQARVELNNMVRAGIRILKLLNEVSSEEGKAVLTALKALAPVTPDVDDGVSQSEVKSLLASAETAMPGPGAGAAPAGGGMARAPLGPMGPRPQAIGGMPFGTNLPVPGAGA